VIEVLAFTDEALAPDPPLRALGAGAVRAVCRPAVDEERTPDALWRHEALLEGLMRDGGVLPVRYGTVVPDEDAVLRALAERRDELAAGLERVRGAVELALRVDARDPSAGFADRAASTGRAMRLHEALGPLARESVLQPSREMVRAAYLVDRGDVDAFVARVRELEAAHPELALVCTGPWPPFSFAEAR
jgi:Gas vesicle synthesis protein GvpL/GvpF